MTILTLKLKNKKDATLIFDFAKKSNIEMQIVEKSNGLGKTAVSKKDKFYAEFIEAVQEAKDIAAGRKKGQSLKSFLDEL